MRLPTRTNELAILKEDCSSIMNGAISIRSDTFFLTVKQNKQTPPRGACLLNFKH